MTRGEIWWANLPAPWGRRPVLLLTRGDAYDVLSWITAAPLTTNTRAIRSTVRLDPTDDGVPQVCIVNLDPMLPVRRSYLEGRITQLRESKMREVEEAIHFALDLRSCR